ncbi:hypothetical protein ACSLNT_29675, partial [Escherichia coli]|uniref:hypothetical protein n=1 Tax=Escherichia coli TaxID=562 RepID=UPI003EE38EAC
RQSKRIHHPAKPMFYRVYRETENSSNPAYNQVRTVPSLTTAARVGNSFLIYRLVPVSGENLMNLINFNASKSLCDDAKFSG